MIQKYTGWNPLHLAQFRVLMTNFYSWIMKEIYAILALKLQFFTDICVRYAGTGGHRVEVREEQTVDQLLRGGRHGAAAFQHHPYAQERLVPDQVDPPQGMRPVQGSQERAHAHHQGEYMRGICFAFRLFLNHKLQILHFLSCHNHQFPNLHASSWGPIWNAFSVRTLNELLEIMRFGVLVPTISDQRKPRSLNCKLLEMFIFREKWSKQVPGTFATR